MPLIAADARRAANAQHLMSVWAIAVAATLTLTACLPSTGGGPPAGLARLNPLTLDPTRLRAAVRLPETVRVLDAELTVAAELTGRGAAEVRHFPLVASRDPGDRLPLVREAKAGFDLTVLRLDTGQATALTAWRTRIAASGHGKITFSVLTGACRTSAGTLDAVPLTTYIAAAPADGFLTLTSETDLVAIARGLGRPFTLAPCATGT